MADTSAMLTARKRSVGKALSCSSSLWQIPDEVWGLKDRLRVLEISNTRVEALPRDIAKCPNVKTLRLPGNRLGVLRAASSKVGVFS